MAASPQKPHPVALLVCAIAGALLTSAFQLLLHRWLSVERAALPLQLRYAALDLALSTPALFCALLLGRAIKTETPRLLAIERAAVTTVITFGLLIVLLLVRDELLLRGVLGGVFAIPQRGFLCGAELYTAPFTDRLSVSTLAVLRLLPILFGCAAITFFALDREARLLLWPTRRRVRYALGGGAVISLLLSGAITCPSDPPPSVPANTGPAMNNGCPVGWPVRHFDISAIRVKITLNRFGDTDELGYMYVLDDQIAAVRAEERKPLPDRVSTGLRADPIQPLVLRANLGDCVEVQFTNRLGDGDAAIQFYGLSHFSQNANGVGQNPDSVAGEGQSLTYRVVMPDAPEGERAYLFNDAGDGRERTSHGLFGVIVPEPKGAVWMDPDTGGPLLATRWEAIIKTATGSSFREFVLQYHEVGDETFNKITGGPDGTLPRVSQFNDIYRPGGRAINYRSEPFHDRMLIRHDEALGYASYPFGDPATPIPRSYLGEPTKTRLVHSGSEMFHVHHLHGGGNRWRMNQFLDPTDFDEGLDKEPESNGRSIRLDSQAIGPGTSFSLAHECGAGGCQQAPGDFLWHCHIGHHYLAGMWSFWRVFDTRQPDLAVIPGRRAPPDAVTSVQLLGKKIEGKTLVSRARLSNADTQIALEDFIESQLPPPGVRLDDDDATVWDWAKQDTERGTLYLREPETREVWPNYRSANPGERLPILFNPENGRYTWPLLRPHLAQRPPFPNAHSGSPWLGDFATRLRPDGVCPTASLFPNPLRSIRYYPLTAISIPLQITPKEVDREGRIFVLGDEKADVLSGKKRAEPLIIRSNVGDCVRLLLTNELKGVGDNRQPIKVNMHTHFVQFDPQGSDSVVSGMAFEQTVKPYPEENRVLASAAAVGDRTINVTNVDKLRVGVWIGIGLGEGLCQAHGSDAFCTEIRQIRAIDGTRLTLNLPLTLSHAQGQAVGVEFMNATWYSDVNVGAVFFHDHVNFKSWNHGQIGMHVIEPPGASYHDPATGAVVRSGSIVDIHAPADASPYPGVTGSFREWALFIHENAEDKQGTISLRAEPPDERGGAPYLRFSSYLHGDPFTPLPRAYPGDPFVVRGIGVPENSGALRITGHRYQNLEPFETSSQLGDSIAGSVSERIGFALEGGAGGPQHRAGDYLYYSTVNRDFIGTNHDFKGGAWGILRVHSSPQGDLRMLPGHETPFVGMPRNVQGDGETPPRTSDPGQPCPSNAQVRAYSVRVARVDLQLQDAPHELKEGGVAYLLDEVSDGGTVSSSSSSAREPLVLRVNVGECLEIDLKNDLGEVASLHVGELVFDPNGSYGAPIGFNADSSVRPGERRRYRYFADRDGLVGATVMLDLTAPERALKGEFGAVVVEPEGATVHNPFTGAIQRTGIFADIHSPSRNFREYVLMYQDEDPRIGQNVMPYPKEPSGLSALSYSLAPLKDRDGPRALAFDSHLHGDPKLLAQANAGDPFIFRVGMAGGEQFHTFAIDGHRFPLEPFLDADRVFTRQVFPGDFYDAVLRFGAGGQNQMPGDYLFADRRMPFMQAGMWGLLRVHPLGSHVLQPLPPSGADAGR